MQFVQTLIDTAAYPTRVFMTTVFLLASQQCILYEYLNDQAEFSDIFNYLIRNSVLLVNFLCKKNRGDLSWRYC